MHRPTWLRLASTIVGLIVLSELVAWGWAVVQRVPSPYPVEWQEGAVTNAAFRLLDGQPIYNPPSAAFISLIYPPFGSMVQEGAMRLFGRGLPAARMVSVIATVVIGLLMLVVIRRQTGSHLGGVLACGLFIAAYALFRLWYDEARIDMLFLALGLGALVLLDVPERTAWRVGAAGVLVGLAILTKQHGLMFALAGVIFLAGRSWRQCAGFALTAALVVCTIGWRFQRESDGWFVRETWSYLFVYPLRPDYLPGVIRALRLLAIPLACALIWPLAGLRRREWGRLTSIWTLGFCCLVPTGLLSMLHEGATINHLIPGAVLAFILQGFAIGELERTGRHPRALALVLALALLPLASWPWPLHAALTPATRAEQAQVVHEIAGMGGEVLVLDDSYYGWLAGKPMNADGASIGCLSMIGSTLPPDLVAGLEQQRYAALVLSYTVAGRSLPTESGRQLIQLIDRYYIFSHQIGNETFEVAHLRVPRYVYLPRALPGQPAGAGYSTSTMERVTAAAGVSSR